MMFFSTHLLIHSFTFLFMDCFEKYRTLKEKYPDVTVLAVTKYLSVEETLDVVRWWINSLGESRVQVWMKKHTALKKKDLSAQLHLIGHLQKNKVKPAIKAFDLIESVDSVALLDRLDTVAKSLWVQQRILLQINGTWEEQKYWFSREEIEEAIDYVKKKGHLLFEWCMLMWKHWDQEKTRNLYKRAFLLKQKYHFSALSMWMSDDREIAVEEWATEVRLWSYLFY